MKKLPTILGLGNKDVSVGKSKHLSGYVLAIYQKNTLYDWIEFTDKDALVKFRDFLTDAIKTMEEQE